MGFSSTTSSTPEEKEKVIAEGNVIRILGEVNGVTNYLTCDQNPGRVPCDGCGFSGDCKILDAFVHKVER